MNKLEAKHSILIKPENMNELQFIEQIGRTCYKSEDKITDDGESAKKFVNMLIRRGHEAMIEHWSYIFECSHAAYDMLWHTVEVLQENHNYSCFLRRSNFGRYVVSGNIRAWRDFIRTCNRAHVTPPQWVLWFFSMHNETKTFLFEDIIELDEATTTSVMLAEPYFDVIQISKYELTPREKEIHYDLTIKFICDRGVSHEIVRHRVSSFAQESTRYCNYAKDKFGNSVSVIDILPGMMLDHKMRELPVDTIGAILSEWEQAMLDAERHYMKMLELGASPQIARDVLSTSTKTELVMTANLGEWFKFFSLRLPDSAHPQMRELTYEAYKDVLELEPDIFEHITATSGE